jgi:DNA processing protein
MDKGLDIVALRAVLALHANHERELNAALGGPPGTLDALIENSRRWSLRWDLADRALAWGVEGGHHIVVRGCAAYPPLLETLAQPPAVLFIDGEPRVLAAAQLAIVGGRRASAVGLDVAAEFATRLAELGVVITSGLALGVDGAAHRGALRAGGSTVAVLGAAIDRIYPRQNRELALHVRQCGALVSEFPFGSAPLAHHFPRRNRVISGLALGTLVVEAGLPSGSLSTAMHALEQGREVFAVPGSVRNPRNRGCHSLIKQGARLTDCVDDILEELPLLTTLHAPAQLVATRVAHADPDINQILDACGWDAFTADDVVQRCGLTVQEVSSMLLKLELAGVIDEQAGGGYLRIR